MEKNIYFNFRVTLITIICVITGGNNAVSATHYFTGLPITSDGWTEIESLVTSNSRIIYVSTSGDDSSGSPLFLGDEAVSEPYSVLEPNMAQVYPYRSLAAGYEQLRDGFADFLLLKRGDEWPDEGLNNWRKSGRSQTERMVFGAYGNESLARPKVGEMVAIRGNLASYLIFTSIVFSPDARSLNFEAGLQHMLLEDVMSPPTEEDIDKSASTGIVIQNINDDGGIDYLAIRRSVVVGRMRPNGIDGYNQGLFINDAENLLIEENIFDHNGRSHDGVPSSGDLRAHNTYIMLGKTGNEHHVFRGNISSRASSDGIMAGSGGNVIANLSVQDPISIVFGKDDNWFVSGVSGTVAQNVMLHGIDISSEDRRGWGIAVGNANGVLIEDNIIAGNSQSGYPYGMRLMALNRSGIQLYVRNVAINDNIIYDWSGVTEDSIGIALYSESYRDGVVYTYGSDPDDYLTDIEIMNNDLYCPGDETRIIVAYHPLDIVQSSGNLFHSNNLAHRWFRIEGDYKSIEEYTSAYGDTTSASGYNHPGQDYGIPSYLEQIGDTPTFEHFYSTLREQRRGHWDTKYMALPIINFVRGSFGREAASYSFTAHDYNGDKEADLEDVIVVLKILTGQYPSTHPVNNNDRQLGLKESIEIMKMFSSQEEDL